MKLLIGRSLLLLALVIPQAGFPAQAPVYEADLIFGPDALHCHASCLVECANGDLLACWYRGSGERRADDVRIEGARRRTGDGWSAPFLMADVPGFPDCNPCMIIDPRGTLHLFWVTIQANEWHTALLKQRISDDYQRRGPPGWKMEQVVHLKPGPEFAAAVSESVAADLERLDRLPEDTRPRARAYLERRREHGADRYFSRLGWMPRAHPYILDRRRLILPLYSDGFDFSLMAVSDDWGETWKTSRPLIGDGPVQPSLVRKRDGTLCAFMRDNGGPPKRIQYSESRDEGMTWAPVRDLDPPNPGSGLEALGLRDGRWALVYNDTERGRHSLAVSLSDDEGTTWRWTRHLEQDRSPEAPATASYPSIIQAKDGLLHVSYTFELNARDAKKDGSGRPLRNCIKHARFNLAWVMAGDGA
jgi:predicted neuraminidase